MSSSGQLRPRGKTQSSFCALHQNCEGREICREWLRHLPKHQWILRGFVWSSVRAGVWGRLEDGVAGRWRLEDGGDGAARGGPLLRLRGRRRRRRHRRPAIHGVCVSECVRVCACVCQCGYVSAAKRISKPGTTLWKNDTILLSGSQMTIFIVHAFRERFSQAEAPAPHHHLENRVFLRENIGPV